MMLLSLLVVSGLAARFAAAVSATAGGEIEPVLAAERAVFQTSFGDIVMGFYPEVAPVTAPHIIRLIQLGCFNGNHFFRVDRGFVAQTADVGSGRGALQLDARQRQEAEKHVPLEVHPRVKHHAGTLSMARSNDPNSGTSSFSILLGDAPHLDMQYAIFGRVLEGMETLRKMEGVETTRSGIFVMPKERISIASSYVFYVVDPAGAVEHSRGWRLTLCDESGKVSIAALQTRLESLAAELQKTREKCLPSA